MRITQKYANLRKTPRELREYIRNTYANHFANLNAYSADLTAELLADLNAWNADLNAGISVDLVVNVNICKVL